MTYTYLFWQDTIKKSFEEKVAEAVAYFRQKYGRAPLFVGVCQGLLSGPVTNGTVPVRPVDGIFSQSHFHLVMEEHHGNSRGASATAGS